MSSQTPGPEAPLAGGQPVTAGLDEMVCFALYSASRALTAKYRELLAPLGLTYPQYLVMIVLWQDGNISVRDLGRRLQLDSGTLSPLLKRLESTGLVNRRRRVDDERSVLVELTPAGSALRQRAADIPSSICASTGLTLGDLEALRTQVDVLAGAVRTSTAQVDVPAGAVRTSTAESGRAAVT